MISKQNVDIAVIRHCIVAKKKKRKKKKKNTAFRRIKKIIMTEILVNLVLSDLKPGSHTYDANSNANANANARKVHTLNANASTFKYARAIEYPKMTDEVNPGGMEYSFHASRVDFVSHLGILNCACVFKCACVFI